jgi:hypothetical protein
MRFICLQPNHVAAMRASRRQIEVVQHAQLHDGDGGPGGKRPRQALASTGGVSLLGKEPRTGRCSVAHRSRTGNGGRRRAVFANDVTGQARRGENVRRTSGSRAWTGQSAIQGTGPRADDDRRPRRSADDLRLRPSMARLSVRSGDCLVSCADGADATGVPRRARPRARSARRSRDRPSAPSRDGFNRPGDVRSRIGTSPADIPDGTFPCPVADRDGSLPQLAGYTRLGSSARIRGSGPPKRAGCSRTSAGACPTR